MSNIEELIGELKVKIIETLGLIDVGTVSQRRTSRDSRHCGTQVVCE